MSDDKFSRFREQYKTLPMRIITLQKMINI